VPLDAHPRHGRVEHLGLAALPRHGRQPVHEAPHLHRLQQALQGTQKRQRAGGRGEVSTAHVSICGFHYDLLKPKSNGCGIEAVNSGLQPDLQSMPTQVWSQRLTRPIKW
jgi:hypothetical protein